MSIKMKRKLEPNKIASDEFIDDELKELESFIEYIEKMNNVTLVGDRNDFNRAKKNWKNMSQGQVAYAIAIWKKMIFERYPF